MQARPPRVPILILLRAVRSSVARGGGGGSERERKSGSGAVLGAVDAVQQLPWQLRAPAAGQRRREIDYIYTRKNERRRRHWPSSSRCGIIIAGSRCACRGGVNAFDVSKARFWVRGFENLRVG